MLFDAAEVADVPELALFDMERGTAPITPEVVAALADAYRIDGDETERLLVLASADATGPLRRARMPKASGGDEMTDPDEDTTKGRGAGAR